MRHLCSVGNQVPDIFPQSFKEASKDITMLSANVHNDIVMFLAVVHMHIAIMTSKQASSDSDWIAAHILFSIASRNAIQNTVIAKQFPN